MKKWLYFSVGILVAVSATIYAAGWNGSGTFSRAHDWTDDRDAGVKILASRMDEEDDNFAAGINACVTQNNENKPTADFKPNADNSYDLGSTSLRWVDLSLSGDVLFDDGTYIGTLSSATLTGNATWTLPDAGGTVTLLSDTWTGNVDAGGNDINNGGVIFLTEQAEANADVAGKGQFWVDTATPNVPMFTDDAGTDHKLGGIGKQTIWIPASAMTPTVSNGSAALTSVETTAGRPDMNVLDFDASSDEHAQFDIAPPKSWNEGTVTYQVYWTSTATDTDGVTWSMQCVSVSDGDTIDVAYGTAVTVDDANQSTAEDLYVTAESGAVTCAGSPAEGDELFFRIFRDVSDANDTAAEDARLLGAKIFFTTDTGTDD